MKKAGNQVKTCRPKLRVLNQRQPILRQRRHHRVADRGEVSVARLEVRVRLIQGRVLHLRLRLHQRLREIAQATGDTIGQRRNSCHCIVPGLRVCVL